jgi:ribosomal protein S12 methylthiotransferase
LPELLKAISALEGHFWVRLLYIHPDHFPLQILDIIEKDRRFLPYFDIPFQHASTKILTAMNRRGTAGKYLELIKTIRTRLPDAVIRSTFLLGFPGETEEDFTALLDFQEKAALDWLGCFTYSREEDTAAYSMKGRVPKKTAKTRRQIIEERQIPITEKNMERFVGKKLEVLIEEQIPSKRDMASCGVGGEESETFLLGRLYCQAPDIDGTAVISGNSTMLRSPDLQPGVFVSCKVITRRGFDLEVQILK